VRILIVDDHPKFIEGLCALLQKEVWMEVCGKAVNGREAIQKTLELKPDLVLMDVTMPVMNGLEAARRLASVSPETPILILTMYENKEVIQAAKEIGVRGYISKSDISERLVNAIHEIGEDRTFFPNEL
jgi:DNA-binding NarL/FixJ family response regulator